MDFSNTLPSITVCFETGFDDYYVCYSDLNESQITYQKEEVQAVKWANKTEVLKLLKEGKFISYKKSLIELLFSLRKKKYGTFEK